MPNAKAKPKAKKTAEPVKLTDVLTKPQQFYIQGNYQNMAAEDIAVDLGLPVEMVKAYIEMLSHDTRATRFSSLLDPVARQKGVIAMTEAASMAADDFRRGGRVTRDMINLASARGDHRLAAELAEKMEKQIQDYAAVESAKNPAYHYIIPPEVKNQLDRRR